MSLFTKLLRNMNEEAQAAKGEEGEVSWDSMGFYIHERRSQVSESISLMLNKQFEQLLSHTNKQNKTNVSSPRCRDTASTHLGNRTKIRDQRSTRPISQPGNMHRNQTTQILGSFLETTETELQIFF